VDVFVPPLVRLALGAGHCQARNGRSLACRLSFVLNQEGAARPPRTTGRFARGPRSDPQDVPRESQLGAPRIYGELLKLGIDIGESSFSKYMVRCRKPPSQTWRTFLENHVKQGDNRSVAGRIDSFWLLMRVTSVPANSLRLLPHGPARTRIFSGVP
jgi:hypothetical protein